MKRWLCVFSLLFFLSYSFGYGQGKQRSWSLRGYVKEMYTLSLTNRPDDVWQDLLTHNRLNFKWFPHDNWTFGAELRTRLFLGSSLTRVPGYSTSIKDANPGLVNLSFNIVDEKEVLLNTTLDRLWLDYYKDKWQVRLGRQRINWGVNLIWNPNDLFNAFSYLDFDYEERPGSDAIRVQYYPGMFSAIDLAIKPDTNMKRWVGAGMYRFNKWNYDFQVLGGWYWEDIAVGGAWAGNLKTAGFKGEFTYFHPSNAILDSLGQFTGTFTVDYSFRNSVYLAFSTLYNSGGSNDFNLGDPNAFFNLSAKNLSPFKYSVFGQISGNITPIINGNVAVMYSPAGHSLFIIPGMTFSIEENWDLLMTSQIFLADPGIGGYQSMGSRVYLRLKWSF